MSLINEWVWDQLKTREQSKTTFIIVCVTQNFLQNKQGENGFKNDKIKKCKKVQR